VMCEGSGEDERIFVRAAITAIRAQPRPDGCSQHSIRPHR
jgi:hypothetical protein